MTSDRDRLIELVDKAKEEYANDITDHTETDYIVETLLNEGAILPPCKVGAEIFGIFDNDEGCKPIPHSLSQYGSGTEVLYRCANCGADFRILGKHETFCHGCGVKQDWENSPIYCSEQFKEMYNELVYKKHAYIQRNRDVDKELKQLLYRFYEGEIK
ncbi:MAG: hypothetical protein II305_06810 [Clostridia bacterium]|nr:hypothetical protein [Clostridia bacterium]